MSLSTLECDKLVTELAVHGNTKVYDVFKKLGFNDVHSIIYGIIEYHKVLNTLEKKVIQKEGIGMIPTSFIQVIIQNAINSKGK